ncbi:hypothetical protein G7Y89_g3462 [Cudoniella acicularis]|uniref:Cellobiose dehydrogenase-like cytochrome domain-containing protein n=1 Tax=Cudoniella acicularis TaxID=354080 RepID=A0A8H4RTB7_9HELO|nr:hypothetical protein G7Y89_g3462 [Cudoniella acicularis]
MKPSRHNIIPYFINALAFAARVCAQSTSYVDPNSGITFQQSSDSTTGFSFGLALPSTVGSDFIGQMVIPTNGTGYGGVSMISSMVGGLLIVAWLNDNSVLASFRETSSTTGGSSNSTCTVTSTNTTATVSNTTYDYIIAGAGLAGIIAAERIAETGASILLIEQGKASTYATGGRSVVSWNEAVTQYDVPSMSYYLTTSSDTTEYCTDTASMARCLLGGGTIVNALMFVRPQEVDFKGKWPTGWKWDDVSTAADRLYSRNPGTTLASTDGKHGASSPPSSPASATLKPTPSNPPTTNKGLLLPSLGHPSLRAGPVKSYFPLANRLTDFHLSLNTKVLRAIRSNSTVTGVEIETSTKSREIINLDTNGRILLAGGTMSTPRILFNSDIGPTTQLTTVQNGRTGITLPSTSNWISLPVGKNLKDHPIFTLTFNITSNTTSTLAFTFTSPNTTDIDLFAHE